MRLEVRITRQTYDSGDHIDVPTGYVQVGVDENGSPVWANLNSGVPIDWPPR
jgi:hypothetical protein